MEKSVAVIMNEQHKLLPEQQKILDKRFMGDVAFLKVPAEGWDKRTMAEICHDICNHYYSVVFVSPIPFMMLELARNFSGIHLFLFHNDKREKKELPDGKVIYTVPSDGWELIYFPG